MSKHIIKKQEGDSLNVNQSECDTFVKRQIGTCDAFMFQKLLFVKNMCIQIMIAIYILSLSKLKYVFWHKSLYTYFLAIRMIGKQD